MSPAETTRYSYVVNKLAMPQLEHKECPQLAGMIAPLTLVFIQQHLNVARLDIPTLHRARFSKGFANALAQLPVDPFLYRNPESLLCPVQNLRRNQVSHRPFEDVFRL